MFGLFDDSLPFHRKYLTLSNDGLALAVRANLWSRSPGARGRPGFVTERELRALSGGMPRKRFQNALGELLDAGKPAHEAGILVPVEGGFEVHDLEQYPLRTPQQPPALSTSRAEAGRLGGLRSVEARRERHGSAQPKQNPEAKPEAPPKQSGFASKQDPEPNPKQTAAASQGPEANAPEAKPEAAAAADEDEEGRKREQVLAVARLFAVAWGQDLRLGSADDPATRAIRELLDAGFTRRELEQAAERARTDPWFEARHRRSLVCLSPEVVRRLVGDAGRLSLEREAALELIRAADAEITASGAFPVDSRAPGVRKASPSEPPALLSVVK